MTNIIYDSPFFRLSGLDKFSGDALFKIFKHITSGTLKRKVTRILTPDEFLSKHILDALMVPDLNTIIKGRVADLGSGGGFPGLVLALAFPESHFVLIDSQQRKCEVMDDLIKVGGIKNASVVCGRFEDLAREPELRVSFDTVVARAVSQMPTLVEYALPFLVEQGLFLAYKGPNVEEELICASKALDELMGSVVSKSFYNIPMKNGPEVIRSAVVIRVEKLCPEKYPRANGRPLKRPLL